MHLLTHAHTNAHFPHPTIAELDYSDTMKVIIVFSGPWLHGKEWKVGNERSMISKAIAKKRRLSIAA